MKVTIMFNTNEGHEGDRATANIVAPSPRQREETSSAVCKAPFTGQLPEVAPAIETLANADMTASEKAAFFTDLDDLIRETGPNKNEQVINLIVACITSGIDSRPRILGVAENKHFKRNHVMSILNRSSGDGAGQCRWQRGSDGRYRLHG